MHRIYWCILSQLIEILNGDIMCVQYLLLLILFIVTSVPYSHDRRIDKNFLTVATYNTNFLFDEESLNDITPWQSPQQANLHVENIASTLKHLDADIINLVEVGSLRMLKKLIQISNMDYNAYLIKGKDRYTGQQVGLLSKIDPTIKLKRDETYEQYPVSEVKSGCKFHPNRKRATGISKHYFTKFDIEIGETGKTVPIVLLGLHLKSNPKHRSSCAQREAQALVARNLLRRLKKQFNNPEMIVLGDFNDFDNAVLDVSNNVPLSKTFEILRDPYYLNLTNVLQFLPKRKRFSHWWDKNRNDRIESREKSLLDHILVTPRLLNALQKVDIAHELYPYGDRLFSDHWPVIAKFDLTKLDKRPVYRVRATADDDDWNDIWLFFQEWLGTENASVGVVIVSILVTLLVTLHRMCVQNEKRVRRRRN